MRIFILLCCSILTCTAQNLRLKDLDISSSFKLNKPWQETGSICLSPFTSKISLGSGKGVLCHNGSKTNETLSSNLNHDDLFLEFDFMLSKSAEAGVLIQGQYSLTFKDSWQGGMSGTLGTKAPRINAAKAPGLWQHVTIMYGQNGIFKKVTLNGAIIHENISLIGNSSVAPLRFTSGAQTVAFRNIKYALLSDANIAWKTLSYESRDIDKETKKITTNIKTGTIRKLDARVANDANYFRTIFKGELSLPETDSYVINLERNGVATLKIDNDEIMGSSWKILPENTTVTKTLTAGLHQVELTYFKDFSWRPTTLALTFQKSNARPTPLHELTSIPEPEPEPLISISPTIETTMQRSYWQLGDKKLTHVVSVGSKIGRHYAYNLDNASPFAIWTGPFLRTTDMWFERGEPQTADPLGPTIYTENLKPLDGLVLSRYRLDTEKNPTFLYVLTDKSTLEDQILPTVNGLKRKLTHAKPQNLILATGNIQLVEKGLWSVDQQYFIKTNEKAILNGKTLTVNSTATITYEIIW